MNLYWTVESFKTALGISGSDLDAEILRLLEAGSRGIDDFCCRQFFTEEGVRYFAGRRQGGGVLIDDCLSATAVATDTSGDASWSTSWSSGEWWLWPANRWPKSQLRLTPETSRSLRNTARFLRVTGTWGYGNGRNADPWKSLGVTGTVADASGATLTVSADGTIETGQTLKLENEQMYVTAVGSGVVTVERGVNGTTASGHTAAAVLGAEYPAPVVQALSVITSESWNLRDKRGVSELQIADYRERYLHTALDERSWVRMLGRYQSIRFGER